MSRLVLLPLFLLPLYLFAQEEAVTKSGKTVLLFPDNTWKLKVENDSIAADSAAVSEVTTDTTIVVPPSKKAKIYSDSTWGFKGFLKSELRLPSLPAQSEGTYVFRVKVNKDGWVKEVLTTQRGPNGEADRAMRNAIARMKFMPDGSILPVLTEGMIRITVPPGY